MTWRHKSVATPYLSLASLALVAALPLGEAAAQGTQVRIGISRTISDAGYYLADAMGFFRDAEGLKEPRQ